MKWDLLNRKLDDMYALIRFWPLRLGCFKYIFEKQKKFDKGKFQQFLI